LQLVYSKLRLKNNLRNINKFTSKNKSLTKLLNRITNHNQFIYNDPDGGITLPSDVKYYKSPCGCVKIPIPKSKTQQHGHYEKRVVNTEQYIFVPGHKPSGMPGAFVVSSEEAHRNMHAEDLLPY